MSIEYVNDFEFNIGELWLEYQYTDTHTVEAKVEFYIDFDRYGEVEMIFYDHSAFQLMRNGTPIQGRIETSEIWLAIEELILREADSIWLAKKQQEEADRADYAYDEYVSRMNGGW